MIEIKIANKPKEKFFLSSMSLMKWELCSRSHKLLPKKSPMKKIKFTSLKMNQNQVNIMPL